jgi:branched-chain amino acid transport system substrate-binding protein
VRSNPRRLAAVLFATTVVAAACGGGTSNSGSGSETLTMYYAAPLTGGAADPSIAGCRGGQLAADDINASGGIPNGPHKSAHLKVECIDNQQSADASATIANRYVADKNVWTMFGFYGSGEALAAALVAQRANLSIIASNVGADFLTDQVHNVAVMLPRLESQGFAGVDLCKTYYKTTTVADLSPDFSFIPSYRKGRDAAVKAESMALVSEQMWPDGSTQDWSPYLSKLNSAGAQCILLGGYPPEQCRIASQARQLGLKQPIIDFTVSGTGPSCVKEGGKYYNGLIFGDALPANAAPGSLQAKIDAEYRTKYNQGLPGYAAYAYDSVLAAEYAIADGAKTREDMVKYLANVDGNGIAGPIKFQGMRPTARTLTWYEVSVSSSGVGQQDPIAVYTLFPDGTAKQQSVADCSSRPTCQPNVKY